MSPKLWKHHKTDRKSIIPNTGKTSYTSSNYKFVRLVCWRNNSNKKTLIYIPYISHYRILSSYNLSYLLNYKNIIKLIKLIIPNTTKYRQNQLYTSPIYGSMRLVHQRNNQKKKTLSIHPMSHVTVAWVHTTWIAKQITNY